MDSILDVNSTRFPISLAKDLTPHLDLLEKAKLKDGQWLMDKMELVLTREGWEDRNSLPEMLIDQETGEVKEEVLHFNRIFMVNLRNIEDEERIEQLKILEKVQMEIRHFYVGGESQDKMEIYTNPWYYKGKVQLFLYEFGGDYEITDTFLENLNIINPRKLVILNYCWRKISNDF